MEFTILKTNSKLGLKPSARVELSTFKAIRSYGFVWSRSQEVFIFNGYIESATQKINGLMNHSFKNFYGYDNKKADYEELEAATFTFESEDVQKLFNDTLAEVNAKKDADKAAAEAKKVAANKNKVDRYNKIVAQVKTLKNGFSTDQYSISVSNCDMSDLLARGGMRVDYRVNDLIKKFNLEHPAVDDGDILEFSIRYGNNWYYDKIESRYLSFEVDHFKHRGETMFMSGGSGHYSSSITLLNNQKRINFKNVVLVSELFTDDLLLKCLQNYLNYVDGKIQSKNYVNSIGIVSSAEVAADAGLQELKEKFDKAIA